jgi:hypothetical protein
MRALALGLLVLLQPSANDAPELFGGGVAYSPENHESAGYFDPSGRRFFFTRTNKDYSNARAYVTELKQGKWSPAQPMQYHRGKQSDAGRRLPDGSLLLHLNAKPGSKDFGDIALARRSGNRWAPSERIPEPVSTDKSECCTAPVGTEGSFYFSSDRDGTWDVFFARKAKSGYAVEKLPGAINSEFGEWPSHAEPNGKFLLFSSIRKGGKGGDDIYISYFRAGKWTPAELLPAPVNSEAYEDGAMLSPDHRLFIWSSRRKMPDGDTSSNIYSLPVDAVGVKFD